MQIFHNPRIERKISFPKFSILFSSKDTNNHHIQLQIYTYVQIFYIPSTERIKKKKNFLPIKFSYTRRFANPSIEERGSK